MAMLPVKAVSAPGEKVTFRLAVPPAASDSGAVELSWNPFGAVRFETIRVPPPVFLKVSGSAGLVVPTRTAPNERLAGVTDSDGPAR